MVEELLLFYVEYAKLPSFLTFFCYSGYCPNSEARNLACFTITEVN